MRVHAEAAEKEFREVALKFIDELFLDFAKDSMKHFRPDYSLDYHTFVIKYGYPQYEVGFCGFTC